MADSASSPSDAAAASAAPQTNEATDATTAATTETAQTAEIAQTAESTEATASTSAPEVAGRPEGSWTFVRRLEEANPPYVDFLAGQPDAQVWTIQPQCDEGPCDLVVVPGDNGYLPPSWPARDDPLAQSFTLALQPDGSYSGIDAAPVDQPCSGSDGESVEGGAARSNEYHLVYLAANGEEAARIEGKLTVNQVPNEAGGAAGCLEFHDVQGLVAQIDGSWSDVDPHSLSFGTYDWGGFVVDADAYYLDHTAGVAQYVHFNSFLDMAPTCSDDPCTVAGTGAAPGSGKEESTFSWDAGQFVSSVTYEDTCVSNDTGDVIAEHGYDVTTHVSLVPAIVIHGEVIAWIGTFAATGTPTPEAAAISPADCSTTHESEAIAASTTQPYFNGL